VTFTVGTLSLCAGGDHVQVPVTIGGQAEDFKFARQELALDIETREEARQAILARMRSAVKEANATTNGQIKAALEGKVFKL
jgi:hypothetical protein